jgi:hypothetical protein
MPQPMATTDVASGHITNGYENQQELLQGTEFAFVTNVSGQTIRVFAVNGPNNGKWFSPSSISFQGPASGPLPDGSNVVTVTGGTSGQPVGGWSYGSNILGNDGHVKIVDGMAQAKAS